MFKRLASWALARPARKPRKYNPRRTVLTFESLEDRTVPAITLSPSSPLTSATVGVAYSATFTGSGGTAPYNFDITSGTLPAGLTLLTSGALSGTPTAGGFF